MLFVNPPPRRAYHHGNLRRALIDAVIAYAAESGTAAPLTLREAARRAGVSHNAPYRHFQTREDLLATVAAEGFAKLSSAMRAAAEGVTAKETRFVRMGLAYFRFAQQQNGYIAVMFGPGVAKSETDELQRNANDAFTAAERMALDAGAARGAGARRLAVVIWSFLHGLAVLVNNDQIPPSVAARGESLAELGLKHLYRSIRAGA